MGAAVRAVVTAECLGCGACRDQCPAQAIDVRDGRYVVGSGCRGCLACLEVCPADAIRAAGVF